MKANGRKLSGYSGIYACHKYWGKKPPETLDRILTNFGFDDCKVLDPFLGAGIIAVLSSQKGFQFFGCDLNPSAVAISNVFLHPPSANEVLEVLGKIEEQCKDQILASYQGRDGTVASHIIWNEGHVDEVWMKQGRQTSLADVNNWQDTNKANTSKFQNVADRVLKKNARINVAEGQKVSDLFTTRAVENIDRLIGAIRQLKPEERKIANFMLTSAVGQMSKMVFALKRRRKTRNNCSKYEVGSWVIGYWLPKIHFEVNCWNVFEGRAKKLSNACSKMEQRTLLNSLSNGRTTIECRDAFEYMANFQNSSIDLIITDPPHNDRIPYLELSEMWNMMLGKKTNFSKEWVTSDSNGRDKNSKAYASQMHDFFSEATRILKDNGCLVMMFNCTDEKIWGKIREAYSSFDCLQFKGRFPLSYSANSVVQDSRNGALKIDWCLVFGKGGFKLPYNTKNNFTDWTDKWVADGHIQSWTPAKTPY